MLKRQRQTSREASMVPNATQPLKPLAENNGPISILASKVLPVQYTTVPSSPVENNVPTAVPTRELSSSSFDSVPPGFQRMEQTTDELSTSSTTLLPSSSLVPVKTSTIDLTVCPQALEEGEFTPVLSKKSKKLGKQAEKTKAKVVHRKPLVRNLQKGAKHRLFR